MAITSTGIGSGLNITNIVDTLVSAERTPKKALLDDRENTLDSKVSAIGSLKSALSSFQDALSKLNSGDALNLRKVTQSKDNYFTATADKNAASGSYNIVVDSLAKSQKLAGLATSDASAAIGSGSLKFAISGSEFTVDVAGTDTLANIADKINSASDNVGVTATVISTDAGSRLVFTSDNTGTDNQMTVTPSGAELSTMFGSGNLETLQSAANSVIHIDGQTLTSQSNKIENAISGVTLDLSDADPSQTTTVTVAQDNDGVKSNIQGFVDAYNSLMDKISALSSYDVDTETAGALQGDSLVRSLESQIRSKLSNRVNTDSGSIALYDIGITTDRYGKLVVDTDSTKLDDAVANRMGDIASLFAADTSDGGIATSLDEIVKGYVKSGGLIDSRNDSYTKEQKRLDKQRESLDIKMNLLQARLTKQFNAMDLVVGNLNSQGSSVVSALSSLPGVVKK
ncbi:flagellar filament capping protein FliD [Shewanella dokdonensis]|uniref:Flagellar hook-associated protein 2 n=1 Tax=Shewanella dokdonensis TaxID=712036 RepID=A0ABX8DGE0_9GAMM|nr:flagellar filament capping protein FliD [Shewanella dokdonensis]MCL1073946.1 flagellar filament capping protein FliD [Shewanella dokdonensis]QVK23713.1 flagellar filament capping protein FliD [Shewanella dokdonensis]